MDKFKEFRAAAAATHSYTDAQIERMFLGLNMRNDQDIDSALGILQAYRPKLLAKIKKEYFEEPETG